MIAFDASGVFRPKTEGDEIRGQALRGAAATVSASVLSLVAQSVSTVILARLLTPDDFGLVAMVTTFSLLVSNFGLNGFTEAVIQCEEIDHQTASNLFWINSSAGLVLGIVFAAAGSLLAWFYGNPLVVHVAEGLSVGIVIAAVSVIHLALIKRAMYFSTSSANVVVGRAINTVASIVLALNGWSYWALVAGSVAQQLSVTLGAWWLCPWMPSLPRRTGKTGTMVRFAAKVYGQYSLSYSSANIDNLLIGWRFNAVALGFYKKAYDLFALSAGQITSPLHNVALAALSRLNHDHDHDRFRRYFASSLGMIAFLGMAVGANFILTGKDVVRLVLGPQWSESGRLFELLAPGIGALLLHGTIGWIHLSTGRPERWLRWSIAALAVTVCLFLLALRWGPEGIATAWSVSYWALLIPGFWYAGKPIGFGVSALIGAVWRYVVGALISGMATAAIIRFTPFWNTASSAGAALEAIVGISALFLTLYLSMVVVLHGGLAPVRQLARLLRELSPSRRFARPTAEAIEGQE